MLTVHRTVALVPAVIPVTVVVVLLVLVIVAVPLCTLHTPVPVVGATAAIVKVLVLHWVMLSPASAVLGFAVFVKMTSSLLSVHVPLLIVHRNVALLPAGTPVTVLVDDPAVVIVAVPDTKVH